MSDYVERAGLRVDARLAEFVETDALPGLDLAADDFWRGTAAIYAQFAPENRDLLEKRETLQSQIDDWHTARQGQPINQDEYQAFLTDIGYLVPEPDAFTITTQNVDDEVARTTNDVEIFHRNIWTAF